MKMPKPSLTSNLSGTPLPFDSPHILHTATRLDQNISNIVILSHLRVPLSQLPSLSLYHAPFSVSLFSSALGMLQ